MLGVGEFCCCLISRVLVRGGWDFALHCAFYFVAEFGFFFGELTRSLDGINEFNLINVDKILMNDSVHGHFIG